MKISELVVELSRLQALHGDVPVVLWDLDTASYFRCAPANLEAQRMGDGSLRLSIGVNGWDDPGEPEPVERPI